MSRGTLGQEDVSTRSVMSSVIRCRHTGRRRRALYVIEYCVRTQGQEDVDSVVCMVIR